MNEERKYTGLSLSADDVELLSIALEGIYDICLERTPNGSQKMASKTARRIKGRLTLAGSIIDVEGSRRRSLEFWRRDPELAAEGWGV